MPERKKGYFESLAQQGFQNNLSSRVNNEQRTMNNEPKIETVTLAKN